MSHGGYRTREELDQLTKLEEKARCKEFPFYYADGSIQLHQVCRDSYMEWPAHFRLVFPVAAVDFNIERREPGSDANCQTKCFQLRKMAVNGAPFYGSFIRFYVEV